MEYSVFDIARALLQRAPMHSLSTVKLQKLCFYVFGWYAHQTGQALFHEPFYAMKLGPVVGELLSAHASKVSVSPEELKPQFEARGETPATLDPYLEKVVDAVWGEYGKFDQWKLVDMTHEEKIWLGAWHGRDQGSHRADMPLEEVVSYFFSRSTRVPEALYLPDARVTSESASWIKELDQTPTMAPASFAMNVASLLSTSR
ncbi:MAG: Panacea domain-containing protein [Brevibacterium aurantiacum]|uniref:Panacea domain-containing protein n=1 Tax=Brevibacterium aurantiacum TaxID=273384 RepID=UPI003F8E01AC